MVTLRRKFLKLSKPNPKFLTTEIDCESALNVFVILSKLRTPNLNVPRAFGFFYIFNSLVFVTLIFILCRYLLLSLVYKKFLFVKSFNCYTAISLLLRVHLNCSQFRSTGYHLIVLF